MNATAISSNGYSVDLQIEDAMEYLRLNHQQVYLDLLVKFPEWENREGLGGTGCWFDYEAMGVDPEWSSWLVDAIEATGLVTWWEGEPWADFDAEELELI